MHTAYIKCVITINLYRHKKIKINLIVFSFIVIQREISVLYECFVLVFCFFVCVLSHWCFVFFSPPQVVYDANTLYIFAPSAQSRDQWVRNLKEGNENCLHFISGIFR